MSAYFALFKCRLLALFQYRAQAIAGIFTQIFWGWIKVMVLTAFYAQSSQNEPITITQAITFIWVGQALLALLPWNIDKEIEADIKNGNIAYELVRPINLLGLWFAKILASKVVPTILRAIPLFFAALLFFGLQPPVSLLATCAFMTSILASALLSAAITTTVIITLFWTLTGEGISRLLPNIAVLLSGILVPLPLFPESIQPFISAQPFRGIVDIPCRIYTGVIPLNEFPYYLLFQLGWTLFFILLAKTLLQRALNKFVIQGG